MRIMLTWLKMGVLILGVLILLGAGDERRSLRGPSPEYYSPLPYKKLDLEVVTRGPAAPVTFNSNKHKFAFSLPAGWAREDSNRVGSIQIPPGPKYSSFEVASFYRQVSPGHMVVFHVGVFGNPPPVKGAKPRPAETECGGKNSMDFQGVRSISLSCYNASYHYVFKIKGDIADFEANQRDLESIINSVKFAH